jgi:hypothetical protein
MDHLGDESEDFSAPPGSDRLAVGALASLAVVSALPFLIEPWPRDFVAPYEQPLFGWLARGAILLTMGLIITARARLDRRLEAPTWRLAVLAALLTLCHYVLVDRQSGLIDDPRYPPGERFQRSYYAEEWQRRLYKAILNGEVETADKFGTIPHVFRALPYGFVRVLERIAHDWTFSFLAYRWFFTFWFLWAFYRFVRLWHDPGQSLVAVATLVPLYPLSIYWYQGQLTDPASHALFVLALLYIVQDRWLPLALALALGVWAKETAIVLVPAYPACYWRRGSAALWRTLALGAIGTAVYFAVRLPLGWSPQAESINGTQGLMIWDNLGFVRRPRTGASLYQNYVHVVLFVGVFVPLIVRRWRHIDHRLRALVLVVVPLVLATSLLFGWLYESRNYVPLLPILTAAAFPDPRPPRIPVETSLKPSITGR